MGQVSLATPLPRGKASWKQTPRMMVLLVAPQGPQTFRIDAGITPNACFQKTCFFTLGQIWLQNGVQKKVPRDPFGYLEAPSGLLWCLFAAPLDSLCDFWYKRDANPSQNGAQGVPKWGPRRVKKEVMLR